MRLISTVSLAHSQWHCSLQTVSGLTQPHAGLQISGDSPGHWRSREGNGVVSELYRLFLWEFDHAKAGKSQNARSLVHNADSTAADVRTPVMECCVRAEHLISVHTGMHASSPAQETMCRVRQLAWVGSPYLHQLCLLQLIIKASVTHCRGDQLRARFKLLLSGILLLSGGA